MSDEMVFPGMTNVGLTKREYFAAAALQGLLACPHQMCNDIDNQAGLAVEYADKLIAELAAPRSGMGTPAVPEPPESTWICSVCERMNYGTETWCRQCEYSRMVARDGKLVPREGR